MQHGYYTKGFILFQYNSSRLSSFSVHNRQLSELCLKPRCINAAGHLSDIAFQPALHFLSAFFRHWEGFLPFHSAFLITKRTMPEFTFDGTGFKIHLFGCRHDHIGFCPEAEFSAGASEQIGHGKPMEGGQEYFLHLTDPSSVLPSHRAVRRRASEPD